MVDYAFLGMYLYMCDDVCVVADVDVIGFRSYAAAVVCEIFSDDYGDCRCVFTDAYTDWYRYTDMYFYVTILCIAEPKGKQTKKNHMEKSVAGGISVCNRLVCFFGWSIGVCQLFSWIFQLWKLDDDRIDYVLALCVYVYTDGLCGNKSFIFRAYALAK